MINISNLHTAGQRNPSSCNRNFSFFLFNKKFDHVCVLLHKDTLLLYITTTEVQHYTTLTSTSYLYVILWSITSHCSTLTCITGRNDWGVSLLFYFTLWLSFIIELHFTFFNFTFYCVLSASHEQLQGTPMWTVTVLVGGDVRPHYRNSSLVLSSRPFVLFPSVLIQSVHSFKLG